MVLSVLGLIAGVARQYAQVDKATQFGERFRILMRSTLDDMLTEAQDSHQMLRPADASFDTELIFDRLDSTTQAARFPALPVPPDPFPATWNPFPPSSRKRVRYYRQGDSLVREMSVPSAALDRNVVFEQASGFSARRLVDNVLEVSVSTEKDAVVVSRSGRVFCPCL